MVRHSPIRQRRTEAEDSDLVLTECRLGARCPLRRVVDSDRPADRRGRGPALRHRRGKFRVPRGNRQNRPESAKLLCSGLRALQRVL
jgi:hypothetical protein